MIDVIELSKKFGNKTAVDGLSFSVRAGMVTGFLGPNGAGKSTTMRLILGLDHPSGGRTRVNGRSYVSARAPMTEVGALLEAKSVHPGRSARSHLRALAATHGISAKRVDNLLEMVGLAQVAKQRAGKFSLGMSQRLGLAAALLGDPETLILDEPINGLDPEGVTWVRNLVKHLASEGRTVFVSSHLMSEMALVADHVIIIGLGRLIVDSPMSELIDRASGLVTKVRSPNVAAIVEAIVRSGRKVVDEGNQTITVTGLTPEALGEEAARRGWVLHELTPIRRTLEDIYMEMTEAALEFQATSQGGAPEAIQVSQPVLPPTPPTPPSPLAPPRSSAMVAERPGTPQARPSFSSSGFSASSRSASASFPRPTTPSSTPQATPASTPLSSPLSPPANPPLGSPSRSPLSSPLSSPPVTPPRDPDTPAPEAPRRPRRAWREEM